MYYHFWISNGYVISLALCGFFNIFMCLFFPTCGMSREEKYLKKENKIGKCNAK